MRGGFRGGRGGFGGGRGGGGFGGGRGGNLYHIKLTKLGFDQGPPEYVQEIATFSHECEGLLIATMTSEQVPLLMRAIYLQNKNKIGKIDDIFGAINSGGIAIKPDEGVKADGFKAGDKVCLC
jgi:H/ACA ribonucleoprotein complex subunit 1